MGERLYKIIHTPKEIAERVDVLAQEIMEHASPKDIFICLLNGGIFFYCDLLKALCIHDFMGVKLNFLRVSTTENKSGQKVAVVLNETFESNMVGAIQDGANVYIVDEIMDSGRSFHAVINWIDSVCGLEGIQRPKFRTVTMLERKGAVHDERVDKHYVGFVEDRTEWFVGYGMDGSDGMMRAFPGIAIEKPEDDSTEEDS